MDEVELERLLAAAVADADPLEVMPPVAGPPGWTESRRVAFRAFHRSRCLDPATAVERTWVVEVSGAAAGAARLQPHGDAVEFGLWLGRSVRGRGVGGRVAELVLAAAHAGEARRLIASTTVANRASAALLARMGATLAVAGDEVTATLELR